MKTVAMVASRRASLRMSTRGLQGEWCVASATVRDAPRVARLLRLDCPARAANGNACRRVSGRWGGHECHGPARGSSLPSARPRPRASREGGRAMGCLTGAFGIILPRFVLLVGWYNDQAYWGSLFS